MVQGPTHHFCNSSMDFPLDVIILKTVMRKDTYREPCIPWVTFRKNTGKTPNQVFRVWIEFRPIGVQCYGQKTSTDFTFYMFKKIISSISILSLFNRTKKINPQKLDLCTRMRSYDSRAAKVGWSFHSSRPWQCFQNWPMLEGLRCPVNERWNWQGSHLQMSTQYQFMLRSVGIFLVGWEVYTVNTCFKKQLNNNLNIQSWRSPASDNAWITSWGSNSGTSITTVLPPRAWAMGGHKRTDWWFFWCMWITCLRRNDRAPKNYVWFNLETVSCMLTL